MDLVRCLRHRDNVDSDTLFYIQTLVILVCSGKKTLKRDYKCTLTNRTLTVGKVSLELCPLLT